MTIKKPASSAKILEQQMQKTNELFAAAHEGLSFQAAHIETQTIDPVYARTTLMMQAAQIAAIRKMFLDAGLTESGWNSAVNKEFENLVSGLEEHIAELTGTKLDLLRKAKGGTA